MNDMIYRGGNEDSKNREDKKNREVREDSKVMHSKKKHGGYT